MVGVGGFGGDDDAEATIAGELVERSRNATASRIAHPANAGTRFTRECLPER